MGRTVEEDLRKRFPAETNLVNAIQTGMYGLNEAVREPSGDLVAHVKHWMLEERVGKI